MNMTFIRNYGTGLIALLFAVTAYSFARQPELSYLERQNLANQFSFTEMEIEAYSDESQKFTREVNPSFEHISGWISAVGASVALNDLDGDGLPNDICHVDPRVDLITVSPVPGTGDRYKPLKLDASPLQYDATTMAPMGCLPVDLNEDGRMDLVAYYWGRTPILFIRTRTGSYRPQEIFAQSERWYTNAATTADLDGDGHLDLIITNYFADGAEVLDANSKQVESLHHSMSRAFNGGSTRIFLSQVTTHGPGRSVSLTEAKNVLERDWYHGWTLAVGAADLDNDLLPELYFANDFGPDRLLHNQSTPGKLKFSLLEGRRDFDMPSSKVVGKDSFKGMGVDFADLNQDGLLDIYVSNIAAEYALLESHFMYLSTGKLDQMDQGRAPYRDESESLGLARSNWSWDSRMADFNNDGTLEALQATGFLKGDIDRWPELQELAMGNDELMPRSNFWMPTGPGDDLSGHSPNHFFVRASDGRFYNLAEEIGIAKPHVTRGIATADVDGDGDLDYAIANQWEDSFFYRNDCNGCAQFLGLKLVLPSSSSKDDQFSVRAGQLKSQGRPAVGASVRLKTANGKTVVAQVDGGNGHSGKRSSNIHFGLGKARANSMQSVEINWRDGYGRLHQKQLELKPGWHTIMLGKGEGLL